MIFEPVNPSTKQIRIPYPDASVNNNSRENQPKKKKTFFSPVFSNKLEPMTPYKDPDQNRITDPDSFCEH